jgi:hypothetical protein
MQIRFKTRCSDHLGNFRVVSFYFHCELFSIFLDVDLIMLS